MRRLATAGLAALPVALGLALFIERCGAIHGEPHCGALSYAAVPFVVTALVLESLFFSAPQDDHVVRVLLWCVVFAVVFLSCVVVVWLRASARRR